MGLIYLKREYNIDGKPSISLLTLVTGIARAGNYKDHYTVRILAYPKTTTFKNVDRTFYYSPSEIEEKIYFRKVLWKEWIRIPKKELVLHLGLANKTPLFYKILKGDYKREIA